MTKAKSPRRGHGAEMPKVKLSLRAHGLVPPHLEILGPEIANS